MTMYQVSHWNLPGVDPVVKKRRNGQHTIKYRVQPKDAPAVPIYVHNDEVTVNLLRITGSREDVIFNHKEGIVSPQGVSAAQLIEDAIAKIKFRPEEGQMVLEIKGTGGRIEVGRWPDAESAVRRSSHIERG